MKWWSSRTWIISLIALIWDTFNYLTNRTFEKQIVLYYPVLCMVYESVCVFRSMFKCSSQETWCPEPIWDCARRIGSSS
jgi:hypothetical protein